MTTEKRKQQSERLEGPRGGHTTITASGWVRKGFHLRADEEAALRLHAAQQRVPEAEIVRSLLREYFSLGPPPEDTSDP